ncbi:MAG: zinc ribbon domain-containing protein, partial [Parabacteroides sp.]|nr:zinc ribbon domain-containing protein [Parabacteroides sp.]
KKEDTKNAFDRRLVMARFCTHCGNEVNENAVVCVKCGCAIPNTNTYSNSFVKTNSVVDVISQRIKTNGIIWIVIGVIQIILGISVNWLLLIVGVLNLISSIQDLNYSQSFPKNPVGIVAKVKPLTSSIITLIYNLLIGGVIGVAGSIYYLVAVRGYVLENERTFCEIENQCISNNS